MDSVDKFYYWAIGVIVGAIVSTVILLSGHARAGYICDYVTKTHDVATTIIDRECYVSPENDENYSPITDYIIFDKE